MRSLVGNQINFVLSTLCHELETKNEDFRLVLYKFMVERRNLINYWNTASSMKQLPVKNEEELNDLLAKFDLSTTAMTDEFTRYRELSIQTLERLSKKDPRNNYQDLCTVFGMVATNPRYHDVGIVRAMKIKALLNGYCQAHSSKMTFSGFTSDNLYYAEVVVERVNSFTFTETSVATNRKEAEEGAAFKALCNSQLAGVAQFVTSKGHLFF